MRVQLQTKHAVRSTGQKFLAQDHVLRFESNSVSVVDYRTFRRPWPLDARVQEIHAVLCAAVLRASSDTLKPPLATASLADIFDLVL